MKATLAACLALTLLAGCGGSSKSAQSQNTVAPPTTNPLGAQPIETGGSEANKEASEEAGTKAEEAKEATEEAGKKSEEASEEAGKKSEEAKEASEEAKQAAEEL